MTELPLHENVLRSALDAWNLSQPIAIQCIPGGLTSEVWLVKTAHGQFVAKHGYQAQNVFESGLYAAELVERNGITSGVPLRTKEGHLSILVQGSHGRLEPLALLQFVPGERLQLTEPDAASLYGYLLGRTHTILLHMPYEQLPFDVYNFLQRDDLYTDTQPGLTQLIQRTIQATQAYEAKNSITYGVVWGDAIEIRRDKETGHVGILDWGALSCGPLLFDVALTVLWYFPEGSPMHQQFFNAYFAESPIAAHELEGINYYKALLFARQAKYFAYRVAAHITLGNTTHESNIEQLALSRRALEQVLASL